MPNLDDRVKVKLTSWIVKQNELPQKEKSAENGIPQVCPETITEVKKRKDLTVKERADSTIEFLNSNSSKLGTVVTIPRCDNGEDVSLLSFQELENKYKEFCTDYFVFRNVRTIQNWRWC